MLGWGLPRPRTSKGVLSRMGALVPPGPAHEEGGSGPKRSPSNDPCDPGPHRSSGTRSPTVNHRAESSCGRRQLFSAEWVKWPHCRHLLGPGHLSRSPVCAEGKAVDGRGRGLSCCLNSFSSPTCRVLGTMLETGFLALKDYTSLVRVWDPCGLGGAQGHSHHALPILFTAL